MLTSTRQAHRPQDADCVARLNAFATGERLREMRFTGRNIGRVLRAAPNRQGVEDLRREIRRKSWGAGGADNAAWDLVYGIGCGAFDHPECWGRSGTPLVLIGHPYHLDDRNREQLAWFRDVLGLEVYVSRAAGWYGHGTLHVRVWVPGALPPPTDAQRFETLVELELEGIE